MASERSERAAVVWRRAPGWVFRVVPGQVLMARPGGAVRTMSGRACVIWIALDVPGTSDQVVERVAEALPETAIEREDVDEDISVLVDGDVIERDP